MRPPLLSQKQRQKHTKRQKTKRQRQKRQKTKRQKDKKTKTKNTETKTDKDKKDRDSDKDKRNHYRVRNDDDPLRDGNLGDSINNLLNVLGGFIFDLLKV